MFCTVHCLSRGEGGAVGGRGGGRLFPPNIFLFDLFAKYLFSNEIAGTGAAQHKNIGVSVMKGTIMPNNSSKNHHRKARWWQMHEVQNAKDNAATQSVHWRSILTRLADRAHTTSIAQGRAEKEHGRPNTYQANEAKKTRTRRSPKGNMSTQKRAHKDLLWDCAEAGCSCRQVPQSLNKMTKKTSQWI